MGAEKGYSRIGNRSHKVLYHVEARSREHH
jgi:hypothetical protein